MSTNAYKGFNTEPGTVKAVNKYELLLSPTLCPHRLPPGRQGVLPREPSRRPPPAPPRAAAARAPPPRFSLQPRLSVAPRRCGARALRGAQGESGVPWWRVVPGWAGVGGCWGSSLGPGDPPTRAQGWRPARGLRARGSSRPQGAAGRRPALGRRGAQDGPPPPPLPRARLRRSGRGPAARALLGGGCCDGEAAAEPEPRSLSHLRHLGLGPPRAGRSCP